MAKDPAILFYPDNFMSGTMFMSDEQVGKYIRLLCAQHLTGHLSEKDMLKICKSFDEDIFCKFKKDPEGKFYNERLKTEMDKRKAFSESRSRNRKGFKKDMINISKTSDKHLGNGNGNGNENEIRIENEKRIVSKNEIFEEIFTDARFIEQLTITHKGKNIKQAWEECYTHHSNAPNPPRETWEWRQKLNSWLTIKSKESNGHKKGFDAEAAIRNIYNS